MTKESTSLSFPPADTFDLDLFISGPEQRQRPSLIVSVSLVHSGLYISFVAVCLLALCSLLGGYMCPVPVVLVIKQLPVSKFQELFS